MLDKFLRLEQRDITKPRGWFAAMHRLAEAALMMLCLLAAAHGSQAAGFGKDHAIVVGIDDYDGKWPGLRYAVADARRVAGFLERQGYDVALLVDAGATRESILGAFRQAALTLGENDRLLFYFGGHGHTDRLGNAEQGYLVPYGSSGVGGMVGMEEVRSMSGLMNVRHQLFVLNSCYGGTIGTLRGAISLVARDRPDYLDQITQRQARQFLAAGGPDQQVLDGGPGGLSWFTHYFLEAVEGGGADLDGDRIVTFPEMQAYLLPRASNSTQTPTSGALPGHAFGEYIFDMSDNALAQSGQEFEIAAANPPQALMTAPTTQLRDIAMDFDAMQRPIHGLYTAWEALDIDAYAAQWSPSAVQRIGSKKRGFADIIARRAKLFPKLAAVEVERYQVWYRSFENGVASFDASYDMAFHFKNGRVVRESERETYSTRKIEGRWLIVENRDYLR
jgi:hypothetical protein